jgi:hypothetical protein
VTHAVDRLLGRADGGQQPDELVGGARIRIEAERSIIAR